MDTVGIMQSVLSPGLMKELIEMIQPFMTPEMMEAMGEWLNMPGGLLETVLKMMSAK
jgi:hypothetical protein